MNKERVLIVHNYYQVPGGEDTVVANEKKMLEDNGHEVFMYTRNNEEIRKSGIWGKIKLPFETIYSFKTIREVKKVIRENKIDIVHVHNTLPLISPSVYKAAKDCGCKVVQTIHNFRLLCPGATFYRDGHICEDCVKHNLRCSIKNSCYRGSKLQTLCCVLNLKIHRLLGTYKKLNYICLTEFNKEKILELNESGKKYVNEKKIFVKPNFVNIDRKIIPFKKRKKQFIFASRLDKLKGIDLVLEAWKKIKDYELVICGTGPMKDWCKQYIKDNNISNVKMLGFVPNEEVLNMIAESKALILPTRWYEGFPMTIVESMACGTPVIGSEIGNVGNIIVNNITGFKFNSIDGLINVVNNLSDICAESKSFYNEHFTVESNYKTLLNIYQMLN